MGRQATPGGLERYFFIPVVGYFLYLPRASLEFPDVRGRLKLGFVLENTLLYLGLGAAAGLLGIPPATWLPTAAALVIAATLLEFVVMKVWGSRFRRLGWHHIAGFPTRRLVLSAVYVAVQTSGFLNLGYALGLLLTW